MMTMNCASAMTASAAQRRGWTAGCIELFSFGPGADPCGLRACRAGVRCAGARGGPSSRALDAARGRASTAPAHAGAGGQSADREDESHEAGGLCATAHATAARARWWLYSSRRRNISDEHGGEHRDVLGDE